MLIGRTLGMQRAVENLALFGFDGLRSKVLEMMPAIEIKDSRVHDSSMLLVAVQCTWVPKVDCSWYMAADGPTLTAEEEGGRCWGQ